MIVLSFSIFLVFFIVIGLLSATKSKGTSRDYLLAGQDIKPWLVALSAVSTNNSGYMFIGQIGFTYLKGLSSIWLMIGWIFGDLLGSLLVHHRLRGVSERHSLLSFGGVISRWHGTNFSRVRLLTGLITLIFLGVYAAAQFKAGSKALHVLFGWDYNAGAMIGAGIVFLYCLAGGIRASIWTDAAQSIVMIGAMAMLLLYAILEAGGLSVFWTSVNSISPHYMDWFPQLPLGEITGPFLFVIGWIFAGIGVIGQPHIMVRFMTLDKPQNIQRVRVYYYLWYTTFYLMAISVGLAARLLLKDVQSFDPELALPQLSLALLPEILVGVMLAGIFAATMSTADSQILSCSAALTKDILPKKSESYLMTKLGTVIVTLVALAIALFGGKNVFNLVLIAWSVLAAAFAPTLIVYAIGRKISETTVLLMILAGVATVLLWRDFGLSKYMYEVAPGIVAGLAVYGLSQIKSIFNRSPATPRN